MNLDSIIASKIFIIFCLKYSKKSRLSCHDPNKIETKEDLAFIQAIEDGEYEKIPIDEFEKQKEFYTQICTKYD